MQLSIGIQQIVGLPSGFRELFRHNKAVFFKNPHGAGVFRKGKGADFSRTSSRNRETAFVAIPFAQYAGSKMQKLNMAFGSACIFIQ